MADKRTIISIGEIPKDYIENLKGKEYVLAQGLLTMAHQHGLQEIDTNLVPCEEGKYAIKATVTGTRGTYSGHGDADCNNVKRGFQGAILRMAETRAVNRALRYYLGIGVCSVEELGPEGPSVGPSLPHSTRPTQTHATAAAGQGTIQNAVPLGQLPACPYCGGRVWDNRDARARGENRRPAVSCMNRDECKGWLERKKDENGEWHSKYVPWIQWDYDPNSWVASPGAPPFGSTAPPPNAPTPNKGPSDADITAAVDDMVEEQETIPF